MNRFERVVQTAACTAGGAVFAAAAFGFSEQGRLHFAILGAFAGLIVLGFIRLVGFVAGQIRGNKHQRR